MLVFEQTNRTNKERFKMSSMGLVCKKCNGRLSKYDLIDGCWCIRTSGYISPVEVDWSEINFWDTSYIISRPKRGQLISPYQEYVKCKSGVSTTLHPLIFSPTFYDCYSSYDNSKTIEWWTWLPNGLTFYERYVKKAPEHMRL